MIGVKAISGLPALEVDERKRHFPQVEAALRQGTISVLP
jgi:hypothetical protein